MQLDQKNVLLGISGGIAAYKTPDLVRKFKATGANVRVVMTDSATEFVSKLALQAVSGNKVSHTMLDEDAEAGMGHIELARWADVFVVAPATANTIAKLAYGLADDLLTTLALATKAPIAIAPAMNQQMWAAPATLTNIDILKSRGVFQIGPGAGEQACGDVGYGRMLEPIEIVEAIASKEFTSTYFEVNEAPILSGLNVMITAGPTREALDPVRYITNHSSGKMGYALATAAKKLGASVTLVSGPVNLKQPDGVNTIQIQSAQDMLDVCLSKVEGQDIFIACAAVADFRLSDIPQHKVKKKEGEDGLTLTFEKNPDILKTVASLDNPPFTLGFAAETQDVEKYATDKLTRKKLNMIAANDVSSSELGFNSDRNALTVITHEKSVKLAPDSKDSLAVELLKLLEQEYRLHKQ
ncbi:bifunctional phosphopantothenoylcysteine decarboxylase/phosphopantothenate--cysteine ligase CoaBC [Glaciecola sp. KUL10]|uniref:bifunctional phosphopantothenoylcysteine decarboxylase/phosphopantothenate--cysteine ligase CoaBC n=1 Tax=Glaciecola sp. (strain KUL10) TaxID=2161813 RepID=UPI000D783587|nr:bifunctional phosphopantothenoylcysteine decarboxylase/phosphopantothenate--cysteine ligase CoaBC [Glaciecola sp. KUL10]GBL05716.1 phosphopantothenoylcysteine decarboxylase/phosphopantothenate--cysteine ligase [Glaciecola sp. KUL10]